ncbi:MAG: hypothetical protein P4L71_08195 [Acetobacteraceae bacterium]|nr:hypothetical protein [Acetobacteraceae bacterium]
MRSLTFAMLGLGVLVLGAASANAAPVVPPVHAQPQSSVVQADYEWHHHHYHHRHWNHGHWRYWD